MTSPREVLIYPGAPKTGTSALQATLRCSVGELSGAGWHYLCDPLAGDPETVGSGNATALYAALSARSDADPLAEFERIAPPGKRSIIASEALFMLSSAEWRPLVELLQSEASSVRVVLCVRDVYPFHVSAYRQNVKLAGATAEFESWDGEGMEGTSEITEIGLVERYLQILEVFGEDRVSLLHYETDRARIVESLLEAGGVPVEACRLDIGGSVAAPRNRTLTQPEVELMRAINSRADAFHAEWCGKTLEARPSQRQRPAGLLHSPTVLEDLGNRAQGSVDRFNELLPAGTPWQLSILDEDLYELEAADPHAAYSAEFADAVEYLLSFGPGEPLRLVLEDLRTEPVSL